MNPLRILIIAADTLARAGLSALLADEDHCLIVGRLGTVTDWDETLNIFRPEVILWDLGWELTEEFDFEQFADINTPILALVPDDEQLNTLLNAGVTGILLREGSADRLAIALEALTRDLRILDPAFDLSQSAAPPSLPESHLEPLEPLTPREQEVLTLLTQGLTNKAIAQELDISPHTVKFHVSAIISKLGAQSRTEAVVLATRMGLLPL